jgi:hypothetical protein
MKDMITTQEPLAIFLVVLLVHWLADFIVQTNWQALNKSENNWALSYHVASYTVCLVIMSAFFPTIPWWWVLINGLVHWPVDWCTSRWSASLFHRQKRREMFIVIGFDQFLHQLALGVTLFIALGTKT